MSKTQRVSSHRKRLVQFPISRTHTRPVCIRVRCEFRNFSVASRLRAMLTFPLDSSAKSYCDVLCKRSTIEIYNCSGCVQMQLTSVDRSNQFSGLLGNIFAFRYIKRHKCPHLCKILNETGEMDLIYNYFNPLKILNSQIYSS